MTPQQRGAALRRGLIVGLLLAACAIALWAFGPSDPGAPARSATHLTLVVPDESRDDDVNLLAWKDAAAELGFPLEVVSASQLMRRTDVPSQAVLIVPDILHQRMNDAMVEHLSGMVKAGSLLMLVHDAGLMSMDGRLHPQQSRLSALAGVRYALYGELKVGMLQEQVPWLDPRAAALLQLPPGKLVRQGTDDPLTSAQEPPLDSEQLAVVGYQYGRLRYPVFATRGTFEGQPLVRADGNNLLAGVHRVGAGKVLFVNMPLTLLKLRTDGLFMHSFLRYFAQDLAHLPQLSAMPDGRGALVMNWHIDAASALPAMEKLAALGVFEQGPYSIHLTVGPDVDVPGDGGGMRLADNAVMQAWVLRFVARGDEIGSHGGWIHNEFGRLVNFQPTSRSTELIERNSAVLSQVSGRAVREYSAPTGNHPAWVTPWLRERGINSYYFTGDIGMPPTRSYQDGRRGPADMWAFPVLSYGKYAAFEEAYAQRVPESQLAAWLNDVADYCAEFRTVRLVYFHPPGMVIYPKAFAQWLEHTAGLVAAGRLRWTSMARFADFSNRRMKVRWSLEDDPALAGSKRLQASHADSLESMSWLVPAKHYMQPQVLQGSAQVVREGAYWRITAGAGPLLTLGVRSQSASAAVASFSAAGGS